MVARLLVCSLAIALTLAFAPAGAATMEARYAAQAHAATNAHRADTGLVKLKKNDCLKKYAVRQAKRMASKRRMFHQDLGPILNTCGASLVGENVGYGYRSGKAVVAAWMRSPSHRANILQPKYRLMAVAARKGGGVWYVAQVFGRKLCRAPRPSPFDTLWAGP